MRHLKGETNLTFYAWALTVHREGRDQLNGPGPHFEYLPTMSSAVGARRPRVGTRQMLCISNKPINSREFKIK